MSYSGRVYTSNYNTSAAFDAASAVIEGVATLLFGAVAGVVTLTAAAVNQVNEAQQTMRVTGLGKELSSIEDDINLSMKRLDYELENMASRCGEGYDKALSEINRICAGKLDLSEYTAKCADMQHVLRREMLDQRALIQDKYISEITKQVKSGQAVMKQAEKNIAESIDNLSADMENKQRAKSAAEKMIAEAELKIEGFCARFDGGSNARSIINELKVSLDRAKAHLASGEYTIALDNACTVNDIALLRVRDMLELEIRRKQAYADAQTLCAGCRDLLEKFESVEYEHKLIGENGRVDLREFFRGDYEEYVSELEAFERELNTDPKDIPEERLDEIYDKLSGFRLRFIGCSGLAYERLLNLAERYDMIMSVMQQLEANGYEYDRIDDSSKLDYINVFFINEHEESLEVKFTAVLESGHIGICIDINDHANYNGSFEQVETQRENVRQTVCDTLNDYTGNKLKFKQMCVNPGVTRR